MVLPVMFPIFLINLDRAGDRWDYMIAELARLLPGATVERALAIDIKVPDWVAPSEYRPGHWKSHRWALGPSDIEIFRSHKDAWQRIAASGQTGLVLEDDLLFSDQFGAHVTALIEADIKGFIRLDATAAQALMEPAHIEMKGVRLHRLRSLGASAAAYLVDPDTAAQLARSTMIERTLDDYLFDPTPEERGARGHDLPILQIEPVVALQAQFGTFTSDARQVPDFLKFTKRVDAQRRKDRQFVGPNLYRLQKEFLRAKHRKAQARRVAQVLEQGGSHDVLKTMSDLRWH